MRYSRLILLAAFLASTALHGNAQSLGSGIDCGCPTTGDYVDLDSGVLPAVNTDMTSPGGTYRLNVSGAGPYNLQVVRVSDGVVVYNTSVPSGFWGFSPDDDRFVFHYLSAGQILVTLVDLTSTSSNKIIWPGVLTATDRRIRFSQHGNYLVLSALHSSTSASLQIIDAHDGSQSFNSNPFTFSPGGDETDAFGTAGWGFSPDLSDRTLFYAYVTGSGLLEWRMVNLQTGEASNPAPVVHVSGYWQFSPCGDVLGLVIQTDPSHMTVSLHKTVTPQSSALTTRYENSIDTVVFRTTASSHIANIGGQDVALWPNLADNVCSIVPDSLTLSPDTVIGGNPVIGRVTISSPAPTGGVTVSLTSSSPSATVPGSVLVSSGQREKTFTIQTSVTGTLIRPVISATADGVTIRDTLTLLPLALSGLSPDRPSVIGGDTLTATVSLTGPAPVSGTTVTLTSSAPSLVMVSSPLVIPAGQISATTQFITSAVGTLDSAQISATALGKTLSTTVLVNPLVSISFDPDTIVGGNSVTFFVSRPLPAGPGGITVQVSSSDSAVIIVPPLTMPEGWNIVWINPLETRGVSQPTTVTASMEARGKTISASITVLPANLQTLHARPDSGCLVGGPASLPNTFIAGATILFEAMLDGESPPLEGQLLVTSSNPSLATTPASVVFPAQTKSAYFSIHTSAVSSSLQEVIITSQYRGISKSDTVRLLTPPLRYDFTDITPPEGGWVSDFEINNANQVLLAGTGNDGSTGYIWQNGIFQRLDSLAGLRTYAYAALNDSGWVGGIDTLNRPALWDGTTTHLLPSVDSILTTGYVVALSNQGDAIGALTDGIFQYSPVLWHNDSVQQFGSYGQFALRPVDINEAGLIILDGSYYNGPFDRGQAAFLWDNGTLTRIFHPYGTEYYWTMYGRAINDSGIAVCAFNPDYSYSSGDYYVWSNGILTIHYSVDPFNRINPLDINAGGVFVGGLRKNVEGELKKSSAFVYAGDRLYDLHCLAPFPSGWELQEAVSVNDAGAIVGRALDNGVDRAFLLTPATTVTKTSRIYDRSIPSAYTLEQNYPNPFNPSTTIRYSLPASSKVRLTVHDLLGREVAVLVDEVQLEGHKEILWDASDLASGVYLYRLSAGTFVQTHKMILLK